MTLGLVCDTCDALSPISMGTCGVCGSPLGLGISTTATESAAAGGLPGASDGTVSGSMPPSVATVRRPLRPDPVSPNAGRREPASAGGISLPARRPAHAPRRCALCHEAVPAANRFCGSCGAPCEPDEASAPPTLDGNARLVLLRGDAQDPVVYQLVGSEHIVGRSQGSILFPEDSLLSPRHACFSYRDGGLVVRDEGSLNGIYLRIRAPITIAPEQPFLVGEQLLVVRNAPVGAAGPAAPGEVSYYGSPRKPSRMHLVQRLAGGGEGRVFRTTGVAVTLGREGNHVNFPTDAYLSGHHAMVSVLPDGTFQLEDLRSRNGTYVKVLGEARLQQGDLLYLGQQLLRVEIA